MHIIIQTRHKWERVGDSGEERERVGERVGDSGEERERVGYRDVCVTHTVNFDQA